MKCQKNSDNHKASSTKMQQHTAVWQSALMHLATTDLL